MEWVICGMNKIIAFTIIISVLICLITIICCYIYVAKTFDKVSDILNKIISKDYDFNLEQLNDTRQSKLMHQVQRIINQTKADIEQSNKEKENVKRFISDISHQLKTPLANMTMYIDLLSDEQINENERHEFIDCIKSQILNIKWLMKSLIKMSQLEVGVIDFEADYNYIKETIALSISSVYAQAVARDMQIIVEDFENIKLFHNKRWTSEAITNILENAIKYSYPSSSIKISVSSMTLFTKIQIDDTGIGIDKKEYNNIFKRFYRGKNSSDYEGSGIGLYLAQLIMLKQGGYIKVDSKVGKGSTFSIFLRQNSLQNCKK